MRPGVSTGPRPSSFVIVGSDLVAGLGTWERADDLRRLVTLVVVSRPHSPSPDRHWDGGPSWSGPGIDVSSSEVRARVAEGRSLVGLVPEPVIRCIQRRDLYAVRR